jgi:hypothetical protein
MTLRRALVKRGPKHIWSQETFFNVDEKETAGPNSFSRVKYQTLTAEN